MKFLRIAAIACLVAVTLSAVSCDTEDVSVGTSADSTSTDSTAENAAPDTGYKDLEGRQIHGTHDVMFGFEGDGDVISVAMATVWTMKSDPAGYKLMYDGAEIGSIQSGSVVTPAGRTELKCEQRSVGGIDVKSIIESDDAVSDVQNKYFRRYIYSYKQDAKQRSITVVLKYTELSDWLASYFERYGISLKSKTSGGEIDGVVKLNASTRIKQILILGNSFISTSDIGIILDDMLVNNGKYDYRVQAISVGYATVSKSWSSYIPDMQSGQYSAVYMCGFYSSSDVTALAQYKVACAKSNTPLIIFPAHNEGHGQTAADIYKDLIFLDWRGEVDALIENGIPKSEFCMDDQHKHSTPLAGYVGASMVYRSIFGEMPDKTDYENLKSRLGDYSGAGKTTVIKESDIRYFK